MVIGIKLVFSVIFRGEDKVVGVQEEFGGFGSYMLLSKNLLLSFFSFPINSLLKRFSFR
jgi:hypothetical protein